QMGRDKRKGVGQSVREMELESRVKEAKDWAERWKRNSDWWAGLANGRNHTEVMRYVEADPGQIYVRASDLDADPYVLNTPSGTVDVRSGAVRRHDQYDVIAKSPPVPYHPAARHELWDGARGAFAPGIEEWLERRVREGTFGIPSQDDVVFFNLGQG